MNTTLRTEEKLLTRIKRLESNEEVIKKEQKLIADERVLQIEQKMQKTVDELTVKISVYLEKLQKKENETRKLYAQFSEAKNAGAGREEMTKIYESRIREMRHKYEETIRILEVKIKELGDHNYKEENVRLHKRIEDLTWELKLSKERSGSISVVQAHGGQGHVERGMREERREEFEVVEVVDRQEEIVSGGRRTGTTQIIDTRTNQRRSEFPPL